MTSTTVYMHLFLPWASIVIFLKPFLWMHSVMLWPLFIDSKLLIQNMDNTCYFFFHILWAKIACDMNEEKTGAERELQRSYLSIQKGSLTTSTLWVPSNRSAVSGWVLTLCVCRLEAYVQSNRSALICCQLLTACSCLAKHMLATTLLVWSAGSTSDRTYITHHFQSFPLT